MLDAETLTLAAVLGLVLRELRGLRLEVGRALDTMVRLFAVAKGRDQAVETLPQVHPGRVVGEEPGRLAQEGQLGEEAEEVLLQTVDGEASGRAPGVAQETQGRVHAGGAIGGILRKLRA